MRFRYQSDRALSTFELQTMIKRSEISDYPIDPFDYWKCDFSNPKTALPVVRRDIALRLQELLGPHVSDSKDVKRSIDDMLRDHRAMEALARRDEALLPHGAVSLRLMWNTYKALTLVLRAAG